MLIQQVKTLTDTILNEVDTDLLMGYTAQISKEVRHSGSPEELRAFHYVKETLDSYGIQTKLMFSDAYISLPGKARLIVKDQEFPCITHAMAAPTPQGGLRGELVFSEAGVGQYGNNSPFKGKILLVHGLAVPGAVKIAQEQGAAAVIFINTNQEHTHEMIVSPVWGNPTPETFQYLPKIPVLTVNSQNGETIKNLINENNSDSTQIWIETEVDTRWRTIPTLIADIPGGQEAGDFVLLSGHIDSWHYGVMDNGTANATMIEVARLMSKHRDKLRRSLRIAFWSGHSHGRYAGSAWYCDQHWEEMYENCVLHVNVDSVGAIGALELTESNCMAETKDLASSAVKQFTENSYQGARYNRSGDQSFWGTGVPSVFLGASEQQLSDEAKAYSQKFGGAKAGGFGWWWHTTEDKMDKIDPVHLLRDCKIYATTIMRACMEDMIPVNQTAAIQELTEFLLAYQEKVKEKFDMSKTLDRIEALKNQVEEANQKIQSLTLSDEDIRATNEWIKSLSRILVPMNYTKENAFFQDPALKQAPIPSLAEMDQLAQTEIGTEPYFMLKTLITRRVNKINFDLKRAGQITETFFSYLGKNNS